MGRAGARPPKWGAWNLERSPCRALRVLLRLAWPGIEGRVRELLRGYPSLAGGGHRTAFSVRRGESSPFPGNRPHHPGHGQRRPRRIEQAGHHQIPARPKRVADRETVTVRSRRQRRGGSEDPASTKPPERPGGSPHWSKSAMSPTSNRPVGTPRRRRVSDISASHVRTDPRGRLCAAARRPPVGGRAPREGDPRVDRCEPTTAGGTSPRLISRWMVKCDMPGH